jgi:hypothetical protein
MLSLAESRPISARPSYHAVRICNKLPPSEDCARLGRNTSKLRPFTKRSFTRQSFALSTRPARAYELGPASKFTLSTSSEARFLYLAMFSSGSGSALSAPQLRTISEAGTFGFTGYSLLALA